MERAEYNRHSRARMAETAKDASRHAAPDAPERIDHRRRCTRHDHRTCCRGSRGSASLPCHTLRKRVENVPRRIAPTAHFERNDVTIICETVHQGFFAEMESIRPHSGSNPRLLCLTNVYFGQQLSGPLKIQSSPTTDYLWRAVDDFRRSVNTVASVRDFLLR